MPKVIFILQRKVGTTRERCHESLHRGAADGRTPVLSLRAAGGDRRAARHPLSRKRAATFLQETGRTVPGMTGVAPVQQQVTDGEEAARGAVPRYRILASGADVLTVLACAQL
jgi:hypothetical protein